MSQAPTRPSPMLAGVEAILDRDLTTLRREVEAFTDERDLWRPVPGIPNVAGTLALHLTGNIQHYFGARLGATGYVRDRAAEFARRDVPRSQLLQEIEAARSAVKAAVTNLTEERLGLDFPEAVSGASIATGEYLLHLLTHFAYHLGQLDYHRRIVTGVNRAVDAMRPADLSSARPAESS